jgi:20S proteasome alpha/beta subunit
MPRYFFLSLIFTLAHVSFSASIHEYGASVLQFSPSGELLQLDYASKAASRGGLIVGLKGSDGVLLVQADRRPDSNLILSSPKRVGFPTLEVGLAVSGLRMDSNYLFKQANELASQHYSAFSSEISSETLSSKLSELYYEHTCTAGVRPIGVNALILGPDSNGQPRVFSCGPQGRGESWRAIAFGRHSGVVNALLRKELRREPVRSTLTLRKNLVPKILKKLKDHMKDDIKCWDFKVFEGIRKNKSAVEWNQYTVSND